VTSNFGSLESPVNPLLYVLAYGASFVAQGSPADMAGLSRIIEEGIRFPGFAFINVQSPCVTYGEEAQQLKAQKARMQSLESLGHDPSDLARATELARDYGTRLYTGVLYRNPNPPPTYGQGVIERQTALNKQAMPRDEILNRFAPGH
jgi:2-oxoglutarate ferredoxin oxidoreductase subunit beta